MPDDAIQIKDNYLLNYSRDEVWEKLNDPDVLAACIKGCAEVQRVSKQKFNAIIRAKVGRLQKDFIVDLDVDDSCAPAAYTLSSIVSVGMFGKAKGLAEVSLIENGQGQTELHYAANINASGMLAKTLPMIEGVASRRVRAFFDAFAAHLQT